MYMYVCLYVIIYICINMYSGFMVVLMWYFMENPILKWMTGDSPMTRETMPHGTIPQHHVSQSWLVYDIVLPAKTS